MNIQFVSAWIRSMLTSPEAALTFYADQFDFSDPPRERFIRNDRVALAAAIRAFSNRDPNNGLGIHKLEAMEYIGDQHAGLVIWKWSARKAQKIFGMETEGQAVETTGTSFHVYSSGKITREVVYSDQIHVARQLGYVPGPGTARRDRTFLRSNPSKTSH